MNDGLPHQMIPIHCNLCGFVPNRTGGAQIFLEGLLQELNRFEDLDFTFFGSSKSKQWLASFLDTPFRFQELGSDSPGVLNRFCASRKLGQSPDEGQIVWSPLNQGVGTRKTTKEIVTIHDLIPQHYSRRHPSYQANWKRQLAFLIRWKNSMHVGRKAAAVVTVSNSNVEELQQALGKNGPKVYGVPNGIDTNKKAAATQQSWAYSGRPEILAVTSGSMPHKGFGTLEKVAKALPDFNFLVVGRHSSVQQSNIKHVGKLSIDELNALFQSSSALFFPSRIEGFGLPVLEALVFGTPVVATDIPVLREVGGSESCYFNMDDIDTAVSQLRSVVSSREVAEHMSTSGRTHARQFTWQHAAKEYRNIFREIANQS